ncbi:MAG: Rpn family recombination-promoting nuclease/putative transposase [Spirochaetes bacterium]|nr:Rpn family recombination-promoting nuclease/putative transposase [Spirochaetota bacterium]
MSLTVNDPHDRFFESVFTEKAVALDHLNEVLPEDLKNNIDTDTIELDRKSYIDEELQRYFSDVVYSGFYKSNNTRLKICFLHEHKSYYVAEPHLQLLRYMLNIWEYFRKIEQRNPLPVVIPLIVYHGTKEWEVKPFHAYFGPVDEVLKRFIPRFDYVLSDFTKYSNEEIRDKKYFRNGKLQLSIYVMKNIFNFEELTKDFESILKSAKIELKDKQEFIHFLNKLAFYLFSAPDSELYEKEINKAIEQEGVEIMSVLEAIKQESKLEEKQNILIYQFREKFGLTKPEEVYIRSIKNIEKLDKALKNIINAKDKEEIINLLS